MTQPLKPHNKVILVGHPNVGKSVVFTQLTGRYTTVCNYPGTTVEIFRGQATVDGQTYEIVDTPGIRSLFASSEDERVTLDVLRKERADLIIQVADGKNLRRELILTAQLSQLNAPMILNLNMRDERDARGIEIDCEKLSTELGIPVVETIAVQNQGFDAMRACLQASAPCSLGVRQPFEWIEDILPQVYRKTSQFELKLANRTTLFTTALLLGTLLHFENYLGPYLDWPTLQVFWVGLCSRITTSQIVVSAGGILGGSLLPVLLPLFWALKADSDFRDRLATWARKPVTGGFILAVTLSLMYQFVGVLGAQSVVGLLEENIFANYVTPTLQTALPSGFLHDLLVGQYGVISMGLTYGIAIVLPVIAAFFLAFSFLEDSGYLPRLTILANRLFRTMGLNGKAFLPMILGLGCVTMATMTTRILNTRKERVIASVLLALGIPCSAQLGVILGIISGISAEATFIVFGTVIVQLLLVGTALSRLFSGQRTPFILELPPIRFPLWKNIWKKTYLRVRWFLKEALPLFILGTLILFLLDQIHLLEILILVGEPVMKGLLDLPRETATVFLMGFLRRDYAAAGLFDMARQGQLTFNQTVVSLTVMTLFVPCLANFFVLIKEHGLKLALGITGFIIVYAILVGSLLNIFLGFL